MAQHSGSETTHEAVGEAIRKQPERFGHGYASCHPDEPLAELAVATGDAR